MEMFAPEFSQFWLTGLSAGDSNASPELRDEEARLQHAALEELAERVNAARSVV